jgi:hypothetical protein
MDNGRFDAMIRVLGSGAPRRRVLAGLLASLPLALSGGATAKKKKKQCKGRKCGGRCIPKTACCTSAECDGNEKCTNGKCVCTPDCVGRACGSDGCDGFCGAFDGSCGGLNEECGPQGQCICVADCDGKVCGTNGCSGTCGSCGPGVTCSAEGQCICQQGYVCFGSTPICNSQSNCVCTSVLEGGVVCAGDLCSLDEFCDSTEFCVGKYGEGFVCQKSGTGCCGQRCVVPCGFDPDARARERSGTTGEAQLTFGRNVGGSDSGKDR